MKLNDKIIMTLNTFYVFRALFKSGKTFTKYQKNIKNQFIINIICNAIVRKYDELKYIS